MKSYTLSAVGKQSVRLVQTGYADAVYNREQLKAAMSAALEAVDGRRLDALIAAKKFLDANSPAPVLSGYRRRDNTVVSLFKRMFP